MDEKEILKDIHALRSALIVSSPFIGSLLLKCDIKITDKVETAAVDNGKTIYVNPKYYSELTPSQRITVMSHEALHLAFRHAERSDNITTNAMEAELYNIAADCCINHILRMHGYELRPRMVTPEKIAKLLDMDVKDIEKLSADALYRLLKEKIKIIMVKVKIGDKNKDQGGEKGGEGDFIIPDFSTDLSDIVGWETKKERDGGKYRGDLRPDLGKEKKDGEGEEKKGSGEGEEKGVRKEGESEQKKAEGMEGEEAGGKSEKSEKERWDEYWRDAIFKAYVTAKNIGKVPLGLERIFQLVKPKVDWRSVLRSALVNGLGNKVASTWIKPSRKCPEDLPGLRRYDIPTIWMLVDMSGSISNKEASQFASEIFSVAKKFRTTVKVIPWDTRPYDTSVLKSPSDISRLKLRGGGGTLIKTALEKLAEEMKVFDAVVILTDGCIGDITDREVQGLLQKIAVKSSATVFATTITEPQLPAKWRLVKIE